MRKILCFGDSNTWGYDCDNPMVRFSSDVRWTKRLEKLLADKYVIIEEGRNGRTISDEIDTSENTCEILKDVLDNNKDIDVLVIMLGTNDVKSTYNISAESIASEMNELIRTVKMFFEGEFILVAPPQLSKGILSYGFDDKSRDKIIQLGKYYRVIAKWNSCSFLDLGSLLKTSGTDGVHLTKDDHHELAMYVYKVITKIETSRLSK